MGRNEILGELNEKADWIDVDRIACSGIERLQQLLPD
jgi:hypothetical protein